jgi:hypothetical protein
MINTSVGACLAGALLAPFRADFFAVRVPPLTRDDFVLLVLAAMFFSFEYEDQGLWKV